MHIPSLRQSANAEGWQLRVDLAVGYRRVTNGHGAQIVWPALMRKLDRLDPGFRA